MADISSQDIAALKATGQSLDVAFQVGKSGVTEGVIGELKKWLEREPLVKVRIMRGARGDADAKSIATDIAEKAGVILVEVRGHTALFYRHRKGQRRRA